MANSTRKKLTKKEVLELQADLQEKIDNYEKNEKPVWEKDDVTPAEMFDAIKKYDNGIGGIKMTKNRYALNSDKIEPRYVQPTVNKMLLIIQEPGRTLEYIDPAVISMYIKDNLEQPFHYLAARMADDLNYNYLDTLNYLDGNILYYNIPEGDHYTPILWDCDKTVPEWVDEAINCIYNWYGLHSTKNHEVPKFSKQIGEFADKLKRKHAELYTV